MINIINNINNELGIKPDILSILFVGDILPADRYYTLGFGIGSIFREDGGKLWENEIKSLTEDCDLVFGNLEAPLITYKNNSIPFAGDESFAEFLKNSGFEILSIANNHILEQGKDGFDSTCRALSEANLIYVGKLLDIKTSDYKIIEKKGFRIAISSFNDIHDIPNPNLYANLDKKVLDNTLIEIKKNDPDFIIISLHWGNEYVHIPSYDQIKFAHSLIDQGVDIVVGHHPHVIQPVERYKNGLIFYSLGNFLFGANWGQKVRSGMAAKVFLSKKKHIEFQITSVHMNLDFSLVIKEKCAWFDNTLSFAEKKMNSLLCGNKKDYNKFYTRLVSRERTKARVLSKLRLIKDINLLSNEGKRMVLSRLTRRILKNEK